MNKKYFGLFLLGTAVLCHSCIDDTYDLKKGVATDVKIEGNKLSLPLGSLSPLVLDSLLNVDSIPMLGKTDGVFSISMSDTLGFSQQIEPIKLSIEPQSETMKVEFTEASIEKVHIDGVSPDPATFKAPEGISIDDLNENLPVLKSQVTTSTATQEIQGVLDRMLQFNAGREWSVDISLDDVVSTGEQIVACGFNYQLPEQVKTIKSIELAARDGSDNSGLGTPIEFVITHPAALAGANKSINFSATFPNQFVLATASGADKYAISDDKHSLTISGLEAQGNTTSVLFYIQEINGIDELINDNGVISMDDVIEYKVDYFVEGDITLNQDIELSDFDFQVELDIALGFSDAVGATKDIEVDFAPIEMPFEGSFGDLEYITSIDYIEFEAEKSILKFRTEMNSGFGDFKLKEGYALKLDFPDELEINDDQSSYDGKSEKICYDAEEHAFYIYDLNALSSTSWNLSLEKLNINRPVVNDTCRIAVNASISIVDDKKEAVDKLVLAGIEIKSMAETLKFLEGEKKASFIMEGSDLFIKDAVVQTDVIVSPIDEVSPFSLNEEVPGEIGRIESIGFTDAVPVTLDMEINGLEGLETVAHLNLNIALPSFLKLSSDDPNVKVEESLEVKVDFDPRKSNKLNLKLQCEGLDFMNEEFQYKGLQPKDSTDGKHYLAYEGNIAINGEVTVDGTEFHSKVLEDMEDISLKVDFAIGDIVVKNFSGLYRGEIDKIEQSTPLDLGEGLAFLKEEGNSITLAEPQLELVLENSISVPVDIELELYGKDEAGNVIPTSVIKTELSIYPAAYENGVITPRETKLFITSDSSKVSKAGYKNIEVKNLANLLQQIPSSIDFVIQPKIKQEGVTHHVDLSKDLSFNGEYAVVIPLKFDDFHMCYNDTIKDLQMSLGETMEMFSNIGVELSMNVKNTLPLGLTLGVEALDAKDKPLADVTIDTVRISAGLGESILEETEQEAQVVKLSIKSKSGDLSSLDKLALSVEAATGTTTVGAVGLRGDQGLQVSDIVFTISGDIETTLSE